MADHAAPPIRRLVVCADGTWNKPDEDDGGQPAPTNVVKMQRAVRAVAADGTSQIVHYHSGVGTGNVLDKWVGGITGAGLDQNILECYDFLVNNYNPGDELYFFGFSRGAYTARSLAGLVRNSGLLRQEFASMEPEAFSLYRDRDPAKHPNSDAAIAFREKFSHEVEIRCIGVWDTVGSLGVPLGFLERLTENRYLFHDVTLSSRVKNAFHALAIDEQRKPFVPTLWKQPKDDYDADANWLEQAWFSGVHSNVGGGYADAGLSDVTFLWMLNRVAGRCDLEFNDDYVKQITRPSYLGRLYDSMSAVYQPLGAVQRPIDQDRAANEALGVHTWEYVHKSVQQRMGDVKVAPTYAPASVELWAKSMQPPDFLEARAIIDGLATTAVA